jgi:hypothetical protein
VIQRERSKLAIAVFTAVRRTIVVSFEHFKHAMGFFGHMCLSSISVTCVGRKYLGPEANVYLKIDSNLRPTRLKTHKNENVQNSLQLSAIRFTFRLLRGKSERNTMIAGTKKDQK